MIRGRSGEKHGMLRDEIGEAALAGHGKKFRVYSEAARKPLRVLSRAGTGTYSLKKFGGWFLYHSELS